jgi:hypothetical protein
MLMACSGDAWRMLRASVKVSKDRAVQHVDRDGSANLSSISLRSRRFPSVETGRDADQRRRRMALGYIEISDPTNVLACIDRLKADDPHGCEQQRVGEPLRHPVRVPEARPGIEKHDQGLSPGHRLRRLSRA